MKVFLSVLRLWPLPLLLGCGPLMQAQSPQFSQYDANKLILNPAFTGHDPGFSSYSAARMQWVQVGGRETQFNTRSTGVAFELPYTGLGLQYLSSTEGSGRLAWQQASFQFAFRNRSPKPAAKHQGEFSLGLSASASWWSLGRPGALVFADQLHPFLGQVSSSSQIPGEALQLNQSPYFEAGGGFLYERRFGEQDDWYFHSGLAFRHMALGAPDRSFRSPVRISTHGVLVKQGDLDPVPIWGVLSWRVDAQAYSAFPQRLAADAWSWQLGYRTFIGDATGIWGGIWYAGRPALGRHIQSLILGAGTHQALSDNGAALLLGFTYDYTLSGLVNDGGGTYELVFSFRFPYRLDGQAGGGRRPPRGMPCPKF
ncbi:MAG: type IX secretion system membrane protein PorP/SprF [Bacteroidia bacterium]|nr:type IX secretion system membrane protein PorP/SprF [Bacteroidia bacterium]